MTETDNPLLARHRKSKIVMGVDDSPAILAILDAAISGAGYTFIGVKNGLDCLRLVGRANPRLLLLDIQMPGMDGIDLCTRLRVLPEFRTLPIAFLTARNTSDNVKAGLAAGGNDFIVKPINVEKLLGRVQFWTSRSADSEPSLRERHAALAALK